MKIDEPYKEFLIVKKEELAPATFLIRFRADLKFEPGQFLQIYVPNIGEATFAPCSNPENSKYFEICVRAAGNTSNAIAKMNPGESLSIRGPYGKGWPTSKLISQNVVIIAGGIGLSPLRPLLYQLDKYKKEFKDIFLLTGCRTEDYLVFKNDKWKFKYQKTIAEMSQNNSACEKGMITELVEKVEIPLNSRILICGPEVMFKPICEILNKKKIADKNIYVSFERRMECGVGICQHCSIGKYLVCKDGPVFRWDKIKMELGK